MSACISRAGEYSDHEPGDWCPRCGAFNEDAIVAERDALRTENEGLRARLSYAEQQWDDAEANVTELADTLRDLLEVSS